MKLSFLQKKNNTEFYKHQKIENFTVWVAMVTYKAAKFCLHLFLGFEHV